MAEEDHMVSLNVYDLSQGLARQLSSSFLGIAIEAIWHTGVVVYGKEYYFGGGIQHAPVGTTPYGTPIRVVELGVTHVPKELFEEYLQEISPRYTAETYSLLDHNCNNFSNEIAKFLVGASIPEYILQLPNDVRNSPMGPLILPMIQRLETTLRAGAVPQAPQFRQHPAPATTRASPPNKTTSRSARDTNGAAKPHKQPTETGNVPGRNAETSDGAKPAKSGGKTPPPTTGATAADPLGDARSRIQEEITREFAAIMASGTLRASEAAALATRRVMERYGSIMDVATK